MMDPRHNRFRDSDRPAAARGAYRLTVQGAALEKGELILGNEYYSEQHFHRFLQVDHDGDPVYMTRLQWDIDRVARDWPELRLDATKEALA